MASLYQRFLASVSILILSSSSSSLSLFYETSAQQHHGPNTHIPSPINQPPIRINDDAVGYSYIEFPQDTFFMESMAQNTDFRPHVTYIPVKRMVNGKEETHLYEITPGISFAKHLAGPIQTPDGSTDITVFGCVLSAKGILYLCAFNRNSVLALDLNKLPATPAAMKSDLEYEGVPSPNDISLDPQDETSLYVVGGTFKKVFGFKTFTNSILGQVFRIDLRHPAPQQKSRKSAVTSIAEGMKTLAGIQVRGSEIWVSQLYDMLVLDKTEPGSRDIAPSSFPSVWKGDDGTGNVWLADNIDVVQGDKKDYFIVPAYDTVPLSTVQNFMQQTLIGSFSLFVVQLLTDVMQRKHFQVSLAFANTFTGEDSAPRAPAPLRLVFAKPSGGNDAAFGDVVHFEVDLQDTRRRHKPWTVEDPYNPGKILGKREFFNEQVTHAGHLIGPDGSGYIVCVNFEEPRILMLNDTFFMDVLE